MTGNELQSIHCFLLENKLSQNLIFGIRDLELIEILKAILEMLATCARKPKVPGSSPAAAYVHR